MLKKLREKKTARKIWIGLAIIIVPAFIFWGFSGALREKGSLSYVGVIAGRKIPVSEFKGAISAAKNRMIMQFGEKFFEIQEQLNLESYAWARLTLLNEAKKRKIKASDQEVVNMIESYPFFQDNEKFNNRIYNETLQYVFRTKPRVFEEETRENIILLKLYYLVTREVKVTEKEIREDYEKQNEELSMDYIASLIQDFTDKPQLKAEEIKEYFENNSLKFKQPFSFNLEYITLETEEKTREAYSLIRDSKDLFPAAKAAGIEVQETGLFSQTGPIPGIGWIPEILNNITNISLSDIIGPVKTDKNFYILKLKEKIEPRIPDFEEVKEKVMAELIEQRSRELAKEEINQCWGGLQETQNEGKKVDFEKSAKSYGLKSGSTKLFKFNSYIEGIGASDNFWTAAKDLKDNEIAKIIEIPAGFFIIRLKERVAIDEKKFEEEKDQLRNTLLSQKKEDYFMQYTGELEKNSRLLNQ